MTTDVKNLLGAYVPVGPTGPMGPLPAFLVKTANYTAAEGDRIIADTSGGSFTITLPATPSTGAHIIITDGDDWFANSVTVARNGETIEGLSEDVVLDMKGVTTDFIYTGTTWQVTTTTGARGAVGPTGSTGPTGVPGSQFATVHTPGNLYVGENVNITRWYPARPITVSKVVARVITPGTEPVVINIKKNGTTLFSMTITGTASTEDTTGFSTVLDDYVTVVVENNGLFANDLYVSFLYTPTGA